MKTDILYNDDCIGVMQKDIDEKSIDIILTSPPYNTARNGADFFNDRKKGRYTTRYVDFNDNRTAEEYSRWTIEVFECFDRILKDNGVVLYNLNYAKNTHETLWHMISDLMKETEFTIADVICWKKRSAVPNTASPNKLTRIWEPVFVFVRRAEYDTFKANKKVVSKSRGTGQKNYENVFNYLCAKNNDGSCDIHKATYSTELCEKLLSIYGEKDNVVFDPFIGTGTTALAAKKMGMQYIGCEIYKPYYDLSVERLNQNENS